MTSEAIWTWTKTKNRNVQMTNMTLFPDNVPTNCSSPQLCRVAALWEGKLQINTKIPTLYFSKDNYDVQDTKCWLHVCICICSKHTLKMYHHTYWRENLVWKINHYCFNWWCRKTIKQPCFTLHFSVDSTGNL